MPYLESAPSLRELADRLSLIQRWNGRTTRPWSVLQHTILTVALLPEEANNYMRLAVLMHDAAEAYTGDIPRGFKCPEQALLESDILAEIYEGLGLGMVYSRLSSPDLKFYDDVAALVEAQCLVHPRQRRDVTHCHLEVHPPSPALVEQGEDIVWNLLDLPRVEATRLWVKAVEKTLQAVHIPEEERV